MQDTDEIDLLEFFQTIWDGKFKIAGVIVMAVLGVVGFFYTQPPPSFTAKTEVKPITSELANRYQISNSLGFFKVYSDKDKDKDKDDDETIFIEESKFIDIQTSSPPLAHQPKVPRDDIDVPVAPVIEKATPIERGSVRSMASMWQRRVETLATDE